MRAAFGAVVGVALALLTGRRLLSAFGTPLLSLAFVWGFMQALDRALGRLAGWGMAKTPKAFLWTIDCIKVRPNFNWWAKDSWSEIIVCGWTWHNPAGFNRGGKTSYILKIEKMTLRLELLSIVRAIRHKQAVKVDLLLVEGLHFKTQKNEASLLNLWEALDLPDDDVNVSAIVQSAQRYGGLSKPVAPSGGGRQGGSSGGVSSSAAGDTARRSLDGSDTLPASASAWAAPDRRLNGSGSAGRLRRLWRGSGLPESGAAVGKGLRRLWPFGGRGQAASSQGGGALAGAWRQRLGARLTRRATFTAVDGVEGARKPGPLKRLGNFGKRLAENWGSSEGSDGGTQLWGRVALRPLPAVATQATRRAARYWRPQWGSERRAKVFYRQLARAATPSCCGCSCGLLRWFSEEPKKKKRSLMLKEGEEAELMGSRRWIGATAGSSVCVGTWTSAATAVGSSASGLDRRIIWGGNNGGGGGGGGLGDGGGEGVTEARWKSTEGEGETEEDASEVEETNSDTPVPGRYHEYPIGDPRRRPLWGVPIRFDIAQLVLLRLRLDVMDLLTIAGHRTLREERVDTKMEVESLVIPRARLEAGDERRRGAWDGVHGVYLGELVWVLIAEAVPMIAPSRLLKNALLAAGYALKDTAWRFGTGALELALNAEHTLTQEMAEVAEFMFPQEAVACCRLRVQLMSGRRVTWRGGPVNAKAHLELLGPAEEAGRGSPHHAERCVRDRADSALRLWTTQPRWDENFDLGPVSSMNFLLRVACYHHRDAVSIDFTGGPGDEAAGGSASIGGGAVGASPEAGQAAFLGEVRLHLADLLMRDEAINETGEIVGWFPLLHGRGTLPGGAEGSGLTAEIKLKLTLSGDVEALGRVASGPLSTRSAAAAHPPAVAHSTVGAGAWP